MEMILFAAGLAFAVISLVSFGWILFRLNLNHAVYWSQMEKLLQAHSKEHAIKLSNIVSHAVGIQGVLAVLKAPDDAWVDSASVRQMFDEAEAPTKKKLMSLMLAGMASGLIATMTVVPAVMNHPDNIADLLHGPALLPLLGGLFGALAFLKAQSLNAASQKIRDRLVNLILETARSDQS